MLVITALLNSLSFPLTQPQAEVIATSRGLDLGAEYSTEIAKDKSFLLSKADAIKLAILSPNISEGGVSISYSDRKLLMSLANAIYAKFEEPLISESFPTVEFLKDW